ncbi:MAG: peptidoglycan D,D-transpeptidase FtsI family protein [Gammaproteobacteria bacterium]
MSEAAVKSPSRVRALAVAVIFVLTASVLFARAFDLQVFKHPFFAATAAREHLHTLALPAHRGMILDRRGQPLAISTPVAAVWANPRVVLGNHVSLAPVAKLLGLDPGEVARDLKAHADRQFLYLARGLPPAKAREALALGVRGVHIQRDFHRYYPAGPVAAQVVGFTNIDDQGQYGLESEYNRWLDGKPGAMRVITSANGLPVESDRVISRPRPGKDLTTSLDMRIQYLAYRTLKHAVEKQHAASGSIVVLNVKTGGVLAMSSQPDYNPNVRSDLEASRYRNRAVTDLFEPGSSFKPFIIAAALDSGKWTPESTVATGNGTFTIGGYTVHDDEKLGTITVTELLEKSSNVGAAKVALSLPPGYLYRILSGFGFGAPAASGFPGATDGRMPFYGTWRPVEQAAISRGYGVSVTALELAEGYLAIADGGVARPATFIKREQPIAGRRVIPAHVAAELRYMLTTVVSPEGTGTLAAIPNYRVAGKTGTAHLYRNGSYSRYRYNSVFAGMAPAADPKLVCVVVLRAASDGQYFGGQVAAPVFRKVMSGALRLRDIAPDRVPIIAGTAKPAKGGAS